MSGNRLVNLLTRPDTTANATAEQEGIFAFVGLLFEARIAAGPGVIVFRRNDRCYAVESLQDAIRNGCRGILSFGVAGGLSPDLRPGDWIIASAVISRKASYATDLVLSRKLLEVVVGAEYAPIVGVDSPIVDPAAKRQMHESVGAVAVDMESHMVAEFAAASGVAFAAMRVVIDPAHRPVPLAALAGLRAGGTTDARSVLGALAKRPRGVPLLARLAIDALTARNALVRTRRMLGPGLGLLDRDQVASLSSPPGRE